LIGILASSDGSAAGGIHKPGGTTIMHNIKSYNPSTSKIDTIEDTAQQDTTQNTAEDTVEGSAEGSTGAVALASEEEPSPEGELLLRKQFERIAFGHKLEIFDVKSSTQGGTFVEARNTRMCTYKQYSGYVEVCTNWATEINPLHVS
jgi:hypothetical protein